MYIALFHYKFQFILNKIVHKVQWLVGLTQARPS